MSSPTETKPREPIFTLPGALTALLVVMFAIHFVRMALPETIDEQVLLAFAFIPARYGTTLFAHSIYDSIGPKIWTFLTYALLHADLGHIGLNSLWLLPFGSALARRFGALRFYVFMAVTAIAGACAQLLWYDASHSTEIAPMIGASAAVSGAMAGAIRFAFARGGFLTFGRRDADRAALVPAQRLRDALRDPRVVAFIGIWFALNLVFGIAGLSTMPQSTVLAWQAHIGGFVAGLLLFSLFDPIRPTDGQDSGDEAIEANDPA